MSKNIKNANYKVDFGSIQNQDSHRNDKQKIERLINVKSTFTRTKTTLQKWRSAIASCENNEYSSYHELQQLYKELESDSEVTNALRLRVDNVTSKDHIFYKNGEIFDDSSVTNFFSQTWFLDFIKYAIEANFFGYSLIRIGNIYDVDKQDKTLIKEVQNISRQHINPKTNKILKDYYNPEDGLAIDDKSIKDAYIIIKEKDGLNRHYKGLFNEVFPYFQYLKNSQKAWNDFIEKYGSAAIIAKTELSDDTHRENVVNFLQNFQGSSYALMGIEDQIETIQPSNSNGDSFVKICQEMKSNINKIILGSELTNDKSFVGTADLQERLLNNIIRADMNRLESIVNHELIPRLINLGVNWLDGITMRFDNSVKEDPEKKFNMVLEMLKVGVKIPKEYIEETFGIPIETIEKEIDKDV